jgi:anti-sigma regulatory factor (Ser/Thr protein kinase)
VWTTKIGISEEQAYKIKLAVIEVCLNAIEHGSGNDPTKTVTIDLFEQNEFLNIEISDTGKGFTLPLTQFPPSQPNRFGLFMVCKLVDELELHSDN